MSKINDLISPKIEVTFRGEQFMLDSGFTLEETPAINLAFGSKNEETKAKGLKQLLKVIVKRLYPKATAEQISSVDAKYSTDLLSVFNQLDTAEDSEDKKAKEVLKKGAK